MAAEVVTETNIKGGEGKTTTTANVGYGLGEKGKRVLFVDMCPQANLTYTVTGEVIKTPENTLYDVMMQGKDIRTSGIIRPTSHPNVFIVPGSIWMSKAEAQLVTADERELRLRAALEPIMDRVDYIIIDTPPSLGPLTVNALYCSTRLIIPVKLEAYGLVGIDILLSTLETLRATQMARTLGIKMPLLGVLVTQARYPLTNDAQGHLKEIQNYFKEKVFNAIIPHNVKVGEANNRRESLYQYAPTSKGAIAYKRMVEEILERVVA